MGCRHNRPGRADGWFINAACPAAASCAWRTQPPPALSIRHRLATIAASRPGTGPAVPSAHRPRGDRLAVASGPGGGRDRRRPAARAQWTEFGGYCRKRSRRCHAGVRDPACLPAPGCHRPGADDAGTMGGRSGPARRCSPPAERPDCWPPSDLGCCGCWRRWPGKSRPGGRVSAGWTACRQPRWRFIAGVAPCYQQRPCI